MFWCVSVLFIKRVSLYSFWCIFATDVHETMKRSSTSSSFHDSHDKQPPAKRGWGLGTLLHGLAGYVRPKKETSTCSVVNSETETSSRDARYYRATDWTLPAENQRVHGVDEPSHADVNESVSNACLSKYESTLSRSSTFSHAQSSADSFVQRSRTPVLPRFRRDARTR